MSCPTGHPVGQYKGLQSDKQGQKAVGERKYQSHEVGGEGLGEKRHLIYFLWEMPASGVPTATLSRGHLLGATVGGVCSLARSQHANVFIGGCF